MLCVELQNMGSLCSRNRGYYEANAEENAQVIYTSELDTQYAHFLNGS